MSRPLALSLTLLLAAPTLSWAGSSNSLLDVSPDGKLLLAANSDNGTVTVIDIAGRKALREIAVGDKPEGVTWIGNGPLAAVTIYREDAVVFFDASSGKIIKKLPVADEPYGIIANKAGTTAWVTHDYPGSISQIDLKGMSVVAEHKVAPSVAPNPGTGLKISTARNADERSSFLRGIAFGPDESRIYVAEFYTAHLHAIDAKTGNVVDTWFGHDVDNLCRHVVIHPKLLKAYLSHVRSKVTVIDGSGSIFPQVSICDLVPANDTRRRKSIGMDTYNSLHVVTNPWEAAISPDGKFIYTVYLATNDMNISRVLDDNYREMDPVGGAVRVGQQPRAVRVSPNGREVYIYNTVDFEIGVHDGQSMKKMGSIKACEPAKTPEWVRGKALFGMALPPMTNPRWVSCFSCHPDGLTDGRVWQNPEGLRKVPSLFGLAHTHPLHWSADRDESQDFEYTIRSRLMRGGGLVPGALKAKPGFQPIELTETMSGRSKDLDALAIYTNSFEVTTLSPHATAGKLSESAERGKTLFFSKEVACATCHSGPYYSDSTLTKPFKLHDVGTGKDDPSEKMGPKYDTPSLLFAYRTAPYLHHGKAKTLLEVLTTQNKGDQHGKTSQLKANQLDDLVAFLKSLPYELPPLETSNTVKDRVPIKKTE